MRSSRGHVAIRGSRLSERRRQAGPGRATAPRRRRPEKIAAGTIREVSAPPPHTLVVYRPSKAADGRLDALSRQVAERCGRLTVLALAPEEPLSRGCCDTRSVLWNSFQREFAAEHVARAREVVDAAAAVDFEVLPHPGRHAAAAVAEEARRRGVDEIVLADPAACGLTRRERRRLRAESPVPVAD